MTKLNGIITNINNKYVILNDKHFINETEFVHTLLPNDVVEYTINNEKIDIIKLLERETQILFGIAKEINIIDNKNIVTIYFPNLPKFFTLTINCSINIKQYSAIILKIGLDFIHILKFYDSIKNRINDKELFINLYEEQSMLCNILPQYEDSKCYYTDEFKDLTHLHTFNVDPTESKDFDDAISIDKNKIYIHIVDANEEIPKLSSYDINSLKHSFTLYLPEKVQNILPSELAENKISLIESKERKTITIEFLIDEINQNIISHSIYKSLIVIKKRYDYNEFNSCLSNFPLLISFYNKWKRKTLNIPHLKMNINNQGKLFDYKLENNLDDAHKIIETMMILTNLTISQHVGTIIPQRYHCKVKSEIPLNSFTENDIINSILSIKKYKPAFYDSINSGHFGLGLNTYTHFTSPIRRYFDVIIHRLISGTIYTNINEILNHINKQELYIEKLVECYNKLKLLSYFEENKEKIWKGYIISVTKNGITIMLSEFLYELFIFELEPKFNLYDKIHIKIKNINWITLNVKAVVV